MAAECGSRHDAEFGSPYRTRDDCCTRIFSVHGRSG